MKAARLRRQGCRLSHIGAERGPKGRKLAEESEHKRGRLVPPSSVLSRSDSQLAAIRLAEEVYIKRTEYRETFSCFFKLYIFTSLCSTFVIDLNLHAIFYH